MADGFARMSRVTQSVLRDNPETSVGFSPPKNIIPYHTRANRQGIPPETRPHDRAPLMPHFQEHQVPQSVPDDARGSLQRVQDSRTHAYHHNIPMDTPPSAAFTHTPPRTVPTLAQRHASPTHDHPRTALAHAAPTRIDSHTTPMHTRHRAAPTHTSTPPSPPVEPTNTRLRAAPTHTPPSPSAAPTHTHLRATPTHPPPYLHALTTQSHLHATPTHAHSHAASMHTHPDPHVGPSHPHLHAAPTRTQAVSNHSHPQAAAHEHRIHQSSLVDTFGSASHTPYATRPRANVSAMIDPGMRSDKEASVPVDLSNDRCAGGSPAQHIPSSAVLRHLPDGDPSHHFQRPSTRSVLGNDGYGGQQQKYGFPSHGDGASVRQLVQHSALRTISDMYDQPTAQPRTSPDGLPINNCPLPPDPGMGFLSNPSAASLVHKDTSTERRSRTFEPPAHALVTSTPQLGKSLINQVPLRNISSQFHEASHEASRISKPADPGGEQVEKWQSMSLSPKQRNAHQVVGAPDLYFNNLVR
eukprot:GEMP01021203.1.p1 GENE.GEMP01021203.1~~GEMP01021203.1.p1  ORF type:complete len:525 (+),score=68.66 GEMP01021203.1:87-1661(+)